MIIPIRCFTCGKVLANKWNEYERLLEEQEGAPKKQGGPSTTTSPNFDKNARGQVLDTLGLTKQCCRRIMLGHVDFD
jgi:DNA-directed RNA polymerase I, II, and III subunit RPABC5